MAGYLSTYLPIAKASLSQVKSRHENGNDDSWQLAEAVHVQLEINVNKLSFHSSFSEMAVGLTGPCLLVNGASTSSCFVKYTYLHFQVLSHTTIKIWDSSRGSVC